VAIKPLISLSLATVHGVVFVLRRLAAPDPR
jgi:hypothetical protein